MIYMELEDPEAWGLWARSPLKGRVALAFWNAGYQPVLDSDYRQYFEEEAKRKLNIPDSEIVRFDWSCLSKLEVSDG